MLELTAYEGKKRLKATGALTILFAVLAAMFVGMYPSFAGSLDPEQLNQLMSAYPDAMAEAFNVQSLATMEGFLAVELYTTGWILLIGLYFGYTAAGMIADDVDRGRMDLLLSFPILRARLVAEKFASLIVPLVAINVVTPIVVYFGADLVGYPVDALDLVMIHALSVPYLLCCGAIGLFLSVVVDRASIAQRGVLGLLFGLFLLESLVSGSDYEWLGNIAPMRYLDPNAILLHSEYDLAGAGILLIGAAVLVVISQLWFTRKDVE